jgi:hypothetical protein
MVMSQQRFYGNTYFVLFGQNIPCSRKVESERGRVFAIGIMIWKCLLNIKLAM